MSMIIEVKGIGIPNKGAELMLVAVMEHFAAKRADVKFVSEPYTDYYARACFGLYQRASLSFKGVSMDWLWGLVPNRLRKQYGIVLDKDIDVVLDASGFAYGDQWGVDKLKHRLGKRMKGYKKNGTKVILLPQALGPFEQAGFKAQLDELVKHADLICVRDNESKQFLTKIVGERDNIAQYPDFTGVVEASAYKAHEHADYGICVIPNAKMLEMRSDGDKYKQEMTAAVRWAHGNGHKVTLLVHEGHKDLALAEHIKGEVDSSIQVLSATDPKEIKQIIKHSRVVVSSRFHGLVSALSQAIPAVATGWSHKYAELMLDYGVSEFMIDDLNDLTKKLSLLCEKESYTSVKMVLERSSKEQKIKINQMWGHIDSILGLEKL